jgi:hypothetical protein
MKLSSGNECESLEQLREEIDKDFAVNSFRSGELAKWLGEMFYEEEAENIGSISDKAADDLYPEILKAIGIHDNTAKNAAHAEAVARLSAYTKDSQLLEIAENAAYSQKELSELLKKGCRNIILAEGKFHIPVSAGNVTYNVVGNPAVELPADRATLAEKHIIVNGFSAENENENTEFLIKLCNDFSIDKYEFVPDIYITTQFNHSNKKYDSKSDCKQAIRDFAERAYRDAGRFFTPSHGKCISRMLSEYYSNRLNAALEKHLYELTDFCSGEKEELLDKLKKLCDCERELHRYFDEEITDSYYQLYDFDYFASLADIIEVEDLRPGIFFEWNLRSVTQYKVVDDYKIKEALNKDIYENAKHFGGFAYGKYTTAVHRPLMRLLRQICGENTELTPEQETVNFIDDIFTELKAPFAF